MWLSKETFTSRLLNLDVAITRDGHKYKISSFIVGKMLVKLDMTTFVFSQTLAHGNSKNVLSLLDIRHVIQSIRYTPCDTVY